MGTKPSKHSSSLHKLKGINPKNLNSKQGSGSYSIIELLKPECLKAKKMKKTQVIKSKSETTYNKANKVSTLEDWLVSSPGLKIDCNYYPKDGELCVLKQNSKRVHPSPGGNELGGEIFSLNRLVMLDRMAEDQDKKFGGTVSTVSISKSSGKLKKRVSFRLPEVTEIIIIYSPKESMDRDQDY